MATKAIIKPELLTWARNRAKVTVEDAAKAVNVETAVIEDWEAGSEAPSLAQLRTLAAKYHFPLAVFYLPEPPADFTPLRDFRRLPTAERGTISPNLAYHIRNAHERRELAIELHEDLREAMPGFPLKAKQNDDPEAVGLKSANFSASMTPPSAVQQGKEGLSISGAASSRNPASWSSS